MEGRVVISLKCGRKSQPMKCFEMNNSEIEIQLEKDKIVQ